MTDRFKLRRFPPVQLFGYAVLRAVLMIVGMFPYGLAPQVGRWLGRIVKALDRRGFGEVAEAVLSMQRQRVSADYVQTSAVIDAEGLGIHFSRNRRRTWLCRAAAL